MADTHKNFAYGTVLTAPSPATSGTSLTLNSGQGALQPAVPFNASVYPSGSFPLASNAEVVRVTAISGDTVTILRAQEGSSARTIIATDQFSASITNKTLLDAELAITKTITQATHGFSVGNVLRYNGTSYVLAQADSSSNADVEGIVSAVNSTNSFVLTMQGYVTGLASLTAGTDYFLSSSSAGALTATAPSSAGQVNYFLLKADSTTSGYFRNHRGTTISASTTYNVKSYGATGNGTTDDYTAIAAAITAAQTAGGGHIYFPAGTYVCSSTPTITGSNIKVSGDGPDSILLVAPSSMVSGGNTNGLQLTGASNIVIRDMCFDGNFVTGAFNIAYSGGWAMPSSVTGATFVTNTTQAGQNHTGTATRGTQETWVVSGDSGYPTGYPIVLQVGNAVTGNETIKVTAGVGTGTWTVIRGWQGPVTQDKAAGTSLQGSIFWNTVVTTYGMQSVKNYIFSVGIPGSTVDGNTYLQTGMPLRINQSSKVIVENCHIRNSRSSGIIVDGTYTSGVGLNMVGSFSTDIIIRGNELYNTFDNAIYLNVMCQNVEVVGNQTRDTQYAGVGAIGATRVTIADNQVRNAGPSLSDSAGIEVGGVIRCAIVGNLVENANFAGIFVENSLQGGSIPSSEVVIADNTVNACNHPLYSSSAGTTPGIQIVGSIGTRVNGNRVNGCDMGIGVSTQTLDTQVSNNTVRFSKGYGIFNGGSSTDDSVVGSIFTGNIVEYSGKHNLYDLAPAVWLENVSAYAGYPNTGFNGMWIDVAPGGLNKKYVVIKGNIFSDASNNGIELDSGLQSGSCIAIHDNEFYNSDRQMYYDGVLTISGGVVTLASTAAAFTAGDVGVKVSVLTYDGQQTGTISSVSTGTATITGFGTVTNGHNVNPAPFTLLASRGYMVRGIFPDAANQTLEIVGNRFHAIAQAIYATNVSTAATIQGNTETAMTGSATVAESRVVSISSSATVKAIPGIDYVYLVSGTTTLTLVTAVGNKNRYTIKNVGTGIVTVATTSSQTIDGATTVTISGQNNSIDVIPDNANWNII